MHTANTNRRDLSPHAEQEEWIFDTVKRATIAHRQTQKRRRVSRVPSSHDANPADPPTAMFQQLDLNAAPLGPPSALHNPKKRSSTRRRSSGATAVRMPSSSHTPTARRISAQHQPKQPLGVDMSFGNSPSTVRQFRRVSSGGAPDAASNENTPPVQTPSTDQPDTADTANNPAKPETPVPATKESLLGHRMYALAVDPALQEIHAQTADPASRAAIARLAGAFADLDRTDPHGALLLLRNMLEKAKAEPKLASALDISGGSGTAARRTSRRTATDRARLEASATAEDPSSNTDAERPRPLPATPSRASSTPTAAQDPPSSSHRPKQSNAHQHRRQQSAPKLVLAPHNPHLKSHRRRQSAVPVLSEFDGAAGTGEFARDYAAAVAAEEERKRLPGNVEPGLEHAGMLADVLYGRWMEGLRARWGRV